VDRHINREIRERERQANTLTERDQEKEREREREREGERERDMKDNTQTERIKKKSTWWVSCLNRPDSQTSELEEGAVHSQGSELNSEKKNLIKTFFNTF